MVLSNLYPISLNMLVLLQDDDSLDNEFDKIFHPEKFDVAQLNPSDTGYVDDERKKYYRCAFICL